MIAQPVQVGVIGAMQRSHPALTDLWLQWTGVYGLSSTEFGMSPSSTPSDPPATMVRFRAAEGVGVTQSQFCDLLGYPTEAKEREISVLQIEDHSEQHKNFWTALCDRELNHYDGPLEWWWRLLILRQRGIQRASKILLAAIFQGEVANLGSPVVSFPNATLRPEGRTAEDIVVGSYEQPKKMVLSYFVDKAEPQGLSLDLSDDTFRARVITSLLSLSLERSV